MPRERFTWHECVQTISDRFKRSLGWSDNLSKIAAEVAADALRREFGGERHYIPSKNGEYKARIQAEYTGRNIEELAQRYACSASTVRRYIAEIDAG